LNTNCFFNYHNPFHSILLSKFKIISNKYLSLDNNLKLHSFIVMDKIRLNVIGVEFTGSQSGAYVLTLDESEGERRLPIVIGGLEAQSIFFSLEHIKPPRPITHDLFKDFAEIFNITVKEVIINKFHEGVFYSILICSSNDKEVSIDSRTSDAVALAIRFNCPIYTHESILSAAGIVMKEEFPGKQDRQRSEIHELSNELKELSLTELESLLQEVVDNEDFEKASQIRDEIKKRKRET